MKVIETRDEDLNIERIECQRGVEPEHGFRTESLAIAQDRLDVTLFELVEDGIIYMDAIKLIAKKP